MQEYLDQMMAEKQKDLDVEKEKLAEEKRALEAEKEKALAEKAKEEEKSKKSKKGATVRYYVAVVFHFPLCPASDADILFSCHRRKSRKRRSRASAEPTRTRPKRPNKATTSKSR